MNINIERDKSDLPDPHEVRDRRYRRQLQMINRFIQNQQNHPSRQI